MSLASLRSLLFTPGSDEQKLLRALQAGADAVIADLEDAVAPARKDEARALVERVLGGSRSPAALMVRVNGAETPQFERDLELVQRLPLQAIVLPKATPESVAALGHERPAGDRDRGDRAGPAARLRDGHRTPGSERSSWAPSISGSSSGSRRGRTGRRSCSPARSSFSTRPQRASAGLSTSSISTCATARGSRRSAGWRARSGFAARRASTLPRSTSSTRAFAPGEGELARARRIVESYESGTAEGRGAVALDGEMIDLPVVERARRLIADDKRRMLDAG